MVEASVSTIPMDPKRAKELFLFTTPLVGDCVAKATGRSLMLPINRLGEAAVVVDKYLQGLASLGIYSYDLRYDNEKDFISYIREQVEYQYHSGDLMIGEEQILRCECGAVEILNSATHKIEKRTNGKTFKVLPDATIRCKKCNSSATPTRAICLLRPKKKLCVDAIDIQPRYYEGVVIDYLSTYFGNKHLISRQRETAVKVNLEGTEISLDNDYVWLHYGKYLKTMGDNPDVVVASNHSVRKGAIYAALASECNQTHTHLIVTPYISFRDKVRDLSMDSLNLNYPPAVLRAFILAHTNWQVQNSAADPTLFRWLTRAVNRLCGLSIQTTSLDNITNKIKGDNLKTGLVNVKKGNALSDNQGLTLALVGN